MPNPIKYFFSAPQAQRRAVYVCLSFLLFCIFTASHPTHADSHIIYVNAQATGANNGTSWANAFVALQSALAVAGTGDEIWVAAGVYYPDEGPGQTNDAPTSTFAVKSGVGLYGGFAGGETALTQRDVVANLTILSGDIDQNDTTDADGIVVLPENTAGTNAYHVVTATEVDTTARLDGFVLTAGVTRFDTIDCLETCGGGIYVNNGSPTLANLIIIGNSALSGGGMYAGSIESTLTNVTFRDNSAVLGGGISSALSKLTLIEVDFDHNSADKGGGLYDDHSTLNLTTVTVNANSADADGGGIYSDGSNATLTDVTFNGNRAVDGSGGGLFVLNSVGFTLTNVIVSSNNALAGSGGGIFSYASNAVLTDVTFTDNYADTGGGIYSDEGANTTYTDVTFARNFAANSGGGMFDRGGANLTNVTFTRNSAGGRGGGLLVDVDGAILNHVTFRQNHAFAGGGMSSGGASRLTNVTFLGNVAQTDGGGMRSQLSNPFLTNVVFSGNRANSGGGLSNVDSGPTLTNVTFSGNQANEGGAIHNAAGSSPHVQNTLIWTNTPNSIYTSEGIPTYTHSLIEGLNPSGTGNLDGTEPSNAPNFMRPVNCGADGCGDDFTTEADESANDDYGDLRLQSISPAIDAGDNSANTGESGPISTIPTDLAGEPRLIAAKSSPATVDIGAYEAQPSAHAGGPYSGNEGASLALDGTASANSAGITNYAWDCTDNGTIDVNAATPAGSTCTYPQDGSYTLRLTITYNDNLTDTATATVNVANVAPIFTPTGNQSTFAGSAKSFALGSFTDPGAEEEWTITVDWGDNTPPTELAVDSAGTLPLTTYTYATGGTYNVLVTVSDGAASDDGNFQVQVNSAPGGAPAISPPANQSATATIAKTFNLGSFTDEDSGGPWSVTVNWGDDSAETTFEVTSSGALPTQTHSYAAVGDYDVLVTVSAGALASSASFRVTVTEEANGGDNPLYLPLVHRP